MSFALVDTRKNIVVQTEEFPFDVHPDFQWIETVQTNIRYGTKYIDGNFVNEFVDPLVQLRIRRNDLLFKSDWMALSDRTMTQAQIDYRQALRDLPETADPQLDENGNLTNVNWPEEP
jgi:hypothetical protein